MNRSALPIRRALTLGVACALLVAAGAGGCNSKRNANTPKPGGANTEKAEKARKLAEAFAVEAVKGGGVKFYWLGAGTTDMARERTVNLSELVKKDGFNTTYREIPGRHYWFLWRDFLAHYAQITFRPQAKS